MRKHGTYARYTLGDGKEPPCRCDDCREAKRRYEKRRASAVAPAYVGASRAREHIAELSRLGVGLKTVASRSGVSHGALSKLVYGTTDRPPSARIRLSTESRILAVSPADASDGARIPADRTWRDVDLLRKRGWTKMAIARAIGQTGPGLRLSRTSVSKRNADAVHALLERPVPERRSRSGRVIAPPEPEPEPEPRRVDDLPRFDEKGDTSWMASGACRLRNVPTWVFFPARGGRRTLESALRVCTCCKVTEQCLAYALANHEPGIWGGTTWVERERPSRRKSANQAEETVDEP